MRKKISKKKRKLVVEKMRKEIERKKINKRNEGNRGCETSTVEDKDKKVTILGIGFTDCK